jgi:hypothetical protein
MNRWASLFFASLLVITFVGSGLRSPAGAAQPEELAQLIDRADKLVVLQSPREGAAVLFESSDRRDRDALKAALRVEFPKRYLHCMCDGTPAIVLYAKGEKIGQITNHHAKLIRCSLWESDRPLVDPEAFLKWFDDRKVPGPRKEYEAALVQEKQFKENLRRWVEAMPPALRPHWESTHPFFPDLAPLRKALAEQIPEKHQRILALFTWYGSGAGPWSGHPSYEVLAEKLLLDYPTADLLAAIRGKELTSAQTEGVARLFGGWSFSQQRPNDLRLLPAELKARLLKHSLASPDGDKRGRALRAFGGE